jgi:NTP pyrophosphatase (non-canonical NTP hydrolase)
MWVVTISTLQAQYRQFVAERDWEQFHNPKNLVMALSGEVGELTELFQWLTPAESAEVMSGQQLAVQVRDELADVFAYLIRLADVLGVDLERAFTEKMVKNAAKYPAAAARGSAARYSTRLPGSPGGKPGSA